jgi:hypothetical protein
VVQSGECRASGVDTYFAYHTYAERAHLVPDGVRIPPFRSRQLVDPDPERQEVDEEHHEPDVGDCDATGKHAILYLPGSRRWKLKVSYSAAEPIDITAWLLE